MKTMTHASRILAFLMAAALLLAALPAEAGENDLFIARPAVRAATLTGFTRARADMALTAETAGKVLEVFADIGEPVPKSGVFARIDPTFVELNLQANQVEQARLGAQAVYLEKETSRYQALVRDENAAQSVLDKFETDLETARQGIEALKVQERTLRERLARATVTAPPGWKITARHIEPGEWVAAGQKVAQAGDFSSLIVPFALGPDEYEALIRSKQSLSLNLPDKNLRAPAEILRVSPAFDPQTRKTGVDLVLRGLKDMRGGIRAELGLELPSASGSVFVPPGSVALRYEQHWLTRETGEQAPVVLLGPGPAGLIEIVSPDVRAGEKFRKKAGP